MEPTQSMAVFAALSAELESLGEGVEGLAGLVADHARQAPSEMRPQILIQAQALDEVTQRLSALRVLALALAQGEAVEAGIDRIPLADLASRLRGVVLRTLTHTPRRQSAGDLLLFD